MESRKIERRKIRLNSKESKRKETDDKGATINGISTKPQVFGEDNKVNNDDFKSPHVNSDELTLDDYSGNSTWLSAVEEYFGENTWLSYLGNSSWAMKETNSNDLGLTESISNEDDNKVSINEQSVNQFVYFGQV